MAIKFELNEHVVEDVKLIRELQKQGAPDDLIQRAYDTGQERRKKEPENGGRRE